MSQLEAEITQNDYVCSSYFQKNVKDVSGKIEPASVSQISTYISHKADLAIDGKVETKSETRASWNAELWFKMQFDSFLCFSEVVIIQSHRNHYAYRMEDAKIFVVNTDTGIVNLCGVLKVGPVMTIEGQTYHIPCRMKCGNEVKVTLQHDRVFYSGHAIIHMSEISAFAKGIRIQGYTPINLN